LPWINTARLGSRILNHIGGQELQTPPPKFAWPSDLLARVRAWKVSSDHTVPTLVHLSHLPLQMWRYHGHRNWRTRMQSDFLPLCPPPPVCIMHRYNSLYKIKKQ
jgi:hypothetical protein